MLASLLLTLAIGCWRDVPLPELIRKRPVIVVGRIAYVARAPAGPTEQDERDDVAFLAVSEVVKAEGVTIAVNAMLPIQMPAASNRVRTSTDIRFKEGDDGVWLLTRSNGCWLATYPKDHLPLAELPQLKRLVAAAPALPATAQ